PFTPDEDKASAPRVAVISDRFWRAHFNADPNAIGKSVVLDDDSYTMIGVMPAAARFPSRLTDVWVPLGLFVQTFPSERGAHPGLTAVGRLKEDITVERARADMDAIA